jgi:hypothetical protein
VVVRRSRVVRIAGIGRGHHHVHSCTYAHWSV